ncbi:DNA-binding pseudobarrel domain-containing protein [Tanacetum coccineum]
METATQDLPIVTHYVPPYEPPISFPGLLAHHAEEALVSRTMESLREIMNQLPPKEKDPGCFILPCYIRNLTVRNALADLEQVVENLLVKIDKFIFPVDFVILDMVEDFRMPIILGRTLLATAHAEVDVFRKLISLEVGNEKVVFKIEDNFNETLTPIESEEIDHRWSMFDQGGPWDIETVEGPNRKHDIDLSLVVKPKVHWCVAILQHKGDGHEFWASCDFYDDQCNGGDLPDNTEKPIDINPNIDLTQEENPFDNEEDCEDLENFGDKMIELILDAVEARLNDDWFRDTIDDEDDLDGIVDYLELKPYDDCVLVVLRLV